MNEEAVGRLRELRQAEIDDALKASNLALTLTANWPGLPKESLVANAVVYYFLRQLLEEIPQATLTTLYDKLGVFCLMSMPSSSDLAKEDLKSFAISLEASPLGRLVDIDVYYETAERAAVVSRQSQGEAMRTCYLCEDQAIVCRRLQRHEAPALKKAFETRFEAWLESLSFSEKLAFLAESALWSELCREWGFGTVTLNGSGSHEDMDLRLILDSIRAVGDGLKQMSSADLSSFDSLRAYGKKMEDSMYTRTAGVNTHKGAIFHLLIATAALFRQSNLLTSETGLKDFIFTLQAEIKSLTAPLFAELEAVEALSEEEKALCSGGLASFLTYGHAGARQEAIQGYETLLKKWLPRFSAIPELRPLLPTMLEHTWDTTTLSRGGFGMLQTLRMMARRAGSEEDLQYLSKWCEEHGLTTGGSADLIALLYYFYLVYRFRAAFP